MKKELLFYKIEILILTGFIIITWIISGLLLMANASFKETPVSQADVNAIAGFPVSLLSQDKATAGVVKIKKPVYKTGQN